jgi:hypothetical protein
MKIMNGEQVSRHIWEPVAATRLKIMRQHSPGETGKTTRNVK